MFISHQGHFALLMWLLYVVSWQLLLWLLLMFLLIVIARLPLGTMTIVGIVAGSSHQEATLLRAAALLAC